MVRVFANSRSDLDSIPSHAKDLKNSTRCLFVLYTALYGSRISEAIQGK